jgi:hypothetical protein
VAHEVAGSNFEEEATWFWKEYQSVKQCPQQDCSTEPCEWATTLNADEPVNLQIQRGIRERRKERRTINPWQSMNGHYAE